MCLCVSCASPVSLLSEILPPFLFSLPFYPLSFIMSEASRGYPMSAGVIQRHLSRLLQVTSSSSNREDSSNHRSISPPLDLFFYLNTSLFLYRSSLFLSIIRRLILYNILSSPRPSPYSLFYHPFYHPYSLKYYIYIHYFIKPYTYSIFYSSILYSLP